MTTRPAAPLPTWLKPEEAARLIDHGLELWDKDPKKRSVRWAEIYDGKIFHFKVHGTNFRILLSYRRPGRAWMPTYCRWS